MINMPNHERLVKLVQNNESNAFRPSNASAEHVIMLKILQRHLCMLLGRFPYCLLQWTVFFNRFAKFPECCQESSQGGEVRSVSQGHGVLDKKNSTNCVWLFSAKDWPLWSSNKFKDSFQVPCWTEEIFVSKFKILDIIRWDMEFLRIICSELSGFRPI